LRYAFETGALIANLLLHVFQSGGNTPLTGFCSYCNRCGGRTATNSLGVCYSEASSREMLQPIMDWNRPDPA
jgi:hypothetical protein